MNALAWTFNEESHAYVVDGIAVPSVTQVLQGAGLCGDLSRIPLYILDRKRAIGEEVHRACEYFDQGDLDLNSLDSQVAPYVLAYVAFRAETGFTPSLVEQRGIGEALGLKFGFCVDRTGTLGGLPVLLDLKTAREPSPWWKLQTAAYGVGLNDNVGAYRRGAVHLKPDGTYSLLAHTDDGDKGTFLAALQIAWWKLRNK